MSDILEDVKNQILSFSLTEQIHLLNFIANCINKQTSILNKNFSEYEALRNLRETSLATVWKTIYNDKW